VDEDAVILTSYLRERHRAGAAALIDLYSRRSVRASVLLRGIYGYGPGQSASPSLPLLENPPLTAIAVDTASRIEVMLDEVAAIARPRLITLERARLLSDEIEPHRLGEPSSAATRLTIYCGRADRVFEVPVFEAACELLYRRQVAGATVLSGIDGTAGGRRRRAHPLLLGARAPLVVIAVGSGQRIGMLLPELGGLFRHPLMTVAQVRLCKRDGQFVSRPEAPSAADEPAGMTPQVKLTVYTSEATRVGGEPAHRAIVRRLRSAGVGGVTAQRGIWGFHGEHAPHGDHFPRHGRHVPVVTTVIDHAERIGVAFDVINALTPGRGLVTAETVLSPRSAEVCA
jgi:PII-like signaling protein